MMLKKSRKIRKTFAHPLQNIYTEDVQALFVFTVQAFVGNISKVLVCLHLGYLNIGSDVSTFLFLFWWWFSFFRRVKGGQTSGNSFNCTSILVLRYTFCPMHWKQPVYFGMEHDAYHFFSPISCSSLIKQTHLFPMPFILSTLILILLFCFVFMNFFFLVDYMLSLFLAFLWTCSFYASKYSFNSVLLLQVAAIVLLWHKYLGYMCLRDHLVFLRDGFFSLVAVFGCWHLQHPKHVKFVCTVDYQKLWQCLLISC